MLLRGQPCQVGALRVLSWGTALSRELPEVMLPGSLFPAGCFVIRDSPEIIPGDAFTPGRQLSSRHVFLTRLKGLFYPRPLPRGTNTWEQRSY